MNRQRLKAMLIKHEGVRYEVYRCTAGKLTIGVGRNLDDVGLSEDEKRFLLQYPPRDLTYTNLHLNMSEVTYLLENDINRVIDDLNAKIPEWFTYPENIQLALADMCFNLGITGLLKFKKMIAAMREGDFDSAADEAMDSRWYKQVKSRGVTIVGMIREGAK
tara:strand:+ start:237 stop:722 length:486 start_codon:yes stop_codon:yes gene_type:complete